MSKEAEVFIIETLDPDDEGNGRFEGAIISRVLAMHDKVCKYRYVRTKREFEKAIKQFGDSNYRYLHISSHADIHGMCTTNQDEIDTDELAEILNPQLRGRRLFLSACELVHLGLAKAIIPKSGCISVIGPNEKVRFTDAAVLWPALYHLMFSHTAWAMKRRVLRKNLERVCKLFRVNMSYFSKSLSTGGGVTQDLLRKD